MEEIILQEIDILRADIRALEVKRAVSLALTKLDECELWLKRHFEEGKNESSGD